ncbi:MAG: transposase DNA-binding-containing protein [Planctomycetaceae bacterium]
MCDGIAEELRGVRQGDERLDKRSVKLIVDPAANAEASINAATTGWADTRAAYRFFDNELSPSYERHAQARSDPADAARAPGTAGRPAAYDLPQRGEAAIK